MTYQPKSYRKFLATSVAAAMVATVAAPAVFANETTVFTDTEGVSSWAGEAINYLVAKEAIDGIGDNKFDPTGDLTRGQAAKILALSLGLTVDMDAETDFEDAASHWSSPFIKAIQDQKPGVIDGRTNGDFDPDGTISRQEMAKMTVLAYGLELDENAIVNFSDNTGWGKAHVEVLASLGVVEGISAGKFDPNGKVNRAQSVVFVHRTEVDNVRVDVEYKTAVVTNVSAINALKVNVTFNVAVNSTDGIDVLNYSINGVNPASVTLSADSKTATLRFASAAEVEVTDGVVVVEPVQTAMDATVSSAKFSDIFTYEDIARPTITKITYTNFQTAKVWFSEPLLLEGNVNISDAGANYTFTPGDDFITVDLTSATLDTNITVSVVGAYDYSNNLVSPNPATATVKKSKSDLVNPTVAGVQVKDVDKFSVTFSEALASVPTVTLNGTDVTIAGGTVTVDSNDATKYNVLLAAPAPGIQTVGVTVGYTDVSLNAGDAYSKVVQFVADTTDPTYVSHEIKTISSTQYLLVKYSEDVTVSAATNALTGSYVDSNSVTKTATPIVNANASLYDPDGNSVSDTIKIDLTSWSAGTYSATLPTDIAQDAALNSSVAKSISFAIGTVGDSGKPTITDIDSDPTTGYSGISVQPSEDKVTISFSEPLQASTALNVNNYRVEGVAVFENAIFDGDQQTVTLTLREGTIAADGLRNLTINNVTDLAGNVMNTVTTQVAFDENVKPLLSSATLTASTTIKLTFSENILEASVTDNDDFEVYIDGTLATIDSVATVAAGNDKEVVLTLNASTVVADLTKPLVVKVLNANDVVDASGTSNSLTTTGNVTVSTQ